jgi:hypothetical protein
VASRTQNPDQADLAALLDDGAVVRTHVLRPTWHFVRAEDIGWLLKLTAPRLRRVTGRALRDTHGLDERSIGQAVTAVAEALASRGPLNRAQLAGELAQRGTGGSAQMLMICWPTPSWTGSSAAAQSPAASTPTRSWTSVCRRHAGSAGPRPWPSSPGATSPGHGPATERGLAYWATLTLTDVRGPRAGRFATPSSRSGPEQHQATERNHDQLLAERPGLTTSTAKGKHGRSSCIGASTNRASSSRPRGAGVPVPDRRRSRVPARRAAVAG